MSEDTGTAKGKRSADRQITQDDDLEADDGAAPSGPFAKASAEVLAKRKIVQARRPLAGSSSSSSSSSMGQSSTKKNPFASTILSSSSTGNNSTGNNGNNNNNDSDSSPSKKVSNTAGSSKVFGSLTGFSGFAAAASSGSGFGGASTQGGFGKAALGSGETSKGSAFGFGSASSGSSIFGTSTSGTTSSSFLSASSGSTTAPAPSLFSTKGGPSPFSFGFATSKPKPSKEADGSPKNASATAALPEHVDLSTGEEDESNLHECRCKSFKWVPQETPSDNKPETSLNGGKKTNPSVQPSESFQNKPAKTAIANSSEEKSTKEPSSQDDNSNENGNKTDSSATKEEAKDDPVLAANERTGDGDTESTKAPSSSSTTSAVPSASSSSGSSAYRWQELGVGPMKLLQKKNEPEKLRLVQRRESTPNGPATKVLLNLNVWKESKVALKQGQENYLSFITVGGEEAATETYLWKFKEVQQAQIFALHLKRALRQAKSCFASEVP